MKEPARAVRAAALGLLLGLAPALAAAPAAWSVDLNAFPLFVRLGWDRAAVTVEPRSGDPGWQEFPAAGAGGRDVRPIELALPGLPRRSPFSLAVTKPVDFSYVIPFILAPEAAAHFAAGAVPGIHLAGLGDNWEVWLNGTPLRSEMHLDAAGDITAHRGNRDIHFPFEGSLLRAGRNILAIRMVADPTFPPAGFHQARPYYIDEYTSIERRNAELWPITLCGLYLFIGLYHLFMFLIRPRDLHNLFYGLFSMDLAVYLFVRTHTANYFTEDSLHLFRVELLALFLILPLVGGFLETLNDSRVRRRTMAYGSFCILLAVAQALAPPPFAHDILRLWQFTAIPALLYYFGWEILGRWIIEGRRRWKRQRELAGARALASVYLESLARTPIGNILIGGFILLSTAIFDIIDAVYMQLDLVLTQYGFFIFTMGTALILANRLGFLHDRLSGLNQDLEERIRVLEETGARLTASERRYRSLFEGTSDPVALLDEELRFIEGNKAAVGLFGLDRPGRASFRLTEALYVEEREGTIPAELLKATVVSQRERPGPRDITLRLKTALGEARPCSLRLERIESLERPEILLRAAPEARYPLLDAFEEGRERYVIESSLAAADEVTRRATANLGRYLPPDEAGFLGMCLREIVVNAVEHGSLEIDFEAKSRSQREGRYFEFLQERRKDPRFRDRRVTVEYSISAARATFRVTDEGSGFDHRAYSAAAEPDPGLLEHGRGILMTRSAFDSLSWNDKGNQATLVKWFGKGKPRA